MLKIALRDIPGWNLSPKRVLGFLTLAKKG
jgi:hypothetical protein